MKTSSEPRKARRNFWIPVAAGVLTRGTQVLLGLRPEGSPLSQLWEFPGGKIEAGEDPEAALARELKEELSIEAEVGELLFASSHQFKETNILILFYRVTVWKGEPKALHHTELSWFEPEQIHSLKLPDANRKALSRILKSIGLKLKSS